MTDLRDVQALMGRFDGRQSETVPKEELKAAVVEFNDMFSNWTAHQVSILMFNLGTKLTDTPEERRHLHDVLDKIASFDRDVAQIRDQIRRQN